MIRACIVHRSRRMSFHHGLVRAPVFTIVCPKFERDGDSRIVDSRGGRSVTGNQRCSPGRLPLSVSSLALIGDRSTYITAGSTERAAAARFPTIVDFPTPPSV